MEDATAALIANGRFVSELPFNTNTLEEDAFDNQFLLKTFWLKTGYFLSLTLNHLIRLGIAKVFLKAKKIDYKT